jgi:uncharacterized SAM-binding protein YcdF (DUF218 family)
MLRIVLAAVVGLVVALMTVWGVWAYQILGHPRVDRPTSADAVVVLGPATVYGSLPTGISLVDRGLSHTLMVSVVDDQHGRVGRLCRGDNPSVVTSTVTCFVPDPATTQGEARAVAALAARQHWRTVIVVAPVYHVARSRMLFQRCFAGTVEMVSPPTSFTTREWLYQAVYQSGAFLKAWLDDGC